MSPNRHVALLALTLFALPLGSKAQQTATTSTQSPPQRDPAAVSVITKAIQVLGGAASGSQVQTIQTSGAIASVSGSSQTPGTFVWKDQITASGFEFRSEFQSVAGTVVLLSGHGKPAQTLGATTQTLPSHVGEAVLPFHLPPILLAAELSNPNYSLTVVGQATVNGQPAIRLHFSIDTDDLRKAISPHDWYFDSQSGLPLRVEYRVPSTGNALNFRRIAAEFGDFRKVGALLLPFKITISNDGSPQNVITIASILLNPNVPPADFDLPAGGTQ